MHDALNDKDASGMSYSERVIKSVWKNHYTHPVQENTNLKLVKIILMNGGEINHKDAKGFTPYDWAVLLGNIYYCARNFNSLKIVLIHLNFNSLIAFR